MACRSEKALIHHKFTVELVARNFWYRQLPTDFDGCALIAFHFVYATASAYFVV